MARVLLIKDKEYLQRQPIHCPNFRQFIAVL